MTYDAEENISTIYKEYKQMLYNLNYSLANKGQSSELIIFSKQNMCPSNTELEKVGIKTHLFGGDQFDN
jgi:hypothetical protein